MTTQLNLLERDWVNENFGVACGIVLGMGGDEFTSDDFRRYLPPPINHNLWGVLMARLRCAGIIKPVGYRTSSRPEANGRAIRTFVGAL